MLLLEAPGALSQPYLRRQLGRRLGGRGEDEGRGAPSVRQRLRREAWVGGFLQGQYVYGGLGNVSEGLIEGHRRIKEQRGRGTLHAIAHHVQVLGEKTPGGAHQQEGSREAPWETEARVLTAFLRYPLKQQGRSGQQAVLLLYGQRRRKAEQRAPCHWAPRPRQLGMQLWGPPPEMASSRLGVPHAH